MASEIRKNYSIDEIYAEIGELGREQLKHLLLICFIHTYYPLHMVSYSFTSREINFQCETQNGTMLRNQCPGGDSNSCQSLMFDPIHETSVVSEWSLVCDRSWLRPSTMSLFMMGVLVGALSLSFVSDARGRKFTVILTLLGMIVSGHLGNYSQSFPSFCLSRVANGFFCGGHILPLFVLLNELIGSSKRGLAAIYMASTWSLGLVILSALASRIQHWRELVTTTTLLGFPIAISAIFLVESPRWYLTKDKLTEANRVLKKIATGNGSLYKPEHKLRVLPNEAKQVRQGDLASPALRAIPLNPVGSLFRGTLLPLTLILLYAWFVNSSSYYGLTLAASQADSGYDIYWATAISAAVEIPACFVAAFLIDTYGRRSSLSNLMITAAIGLIGIFFVSTHETLVFGLATLAKLCISASFTVLYIHSSEIFPTSFRNTAMGVMAISSRIGGIMSPYLAQIGSVMPNLHFLVFGLLALTSGYLNRTLPETCGAQLPESLDDLLQLVQESRSKRYRKLENSIDI